MKYDILTIFPEFFDSPFSFGILKKAQDKGLLEINTHDIRAYSEDKHKTVDDTPYGGGGGMLMKIEPVAAALENVKKTGKKSLVVLTTPDGEKFTDKMARELADYDQITIICGRYEGIDERIRDLYVDKEISIGDYVLSGGENAASVIVESVSRFIPGVLGNELSPQNDSFNQGLLEYPQYTRPENFEGKSVPEVLLSGNHGDIDKWRKRESIKRTFKKRPDLLDKATLDNQDIHFVKELKEFYNEFWVDTSKDGDLGLIICVRGQIYEHSSADMSLSKYTLPYLAMGSGAEYAYGVLYATDKQKNARNRVMQAVNAAIKFNPSCMGPVDVVSL